MADDGDERLIKPISERQFELYALSLERGPNFDPAHIFAAYKVGRGSACGLHPARPGTRCLHHLGAASTHRPLLGAHRRGRAIRHPRSSP